MGRLKRSHPTFDRCVIYATGDAAIAGTCWGDLRCIDVEISLLDRHVTVSM
jgi:hypothetical protein